MENTLRRHGGVADKHDQRCVWQKLTTSSLPNKAFRADGHGSADRKLNPQTLNPKPP